jgi:thioredoxin-dependent peroxiredoxin
MPRRAKIAANTHHLIGYLMLDVGDLALDFTLPRDGGGQVTLSALRPDRVVLFFYPKDDTSGCTAEALAFTAAQADFADAGAKLLGLSKDTVAKHDKFRDKHGLSVPLLSDAEGDICEQYGVWAEKQMYGKSYFGILRTTLLIGPDGRIEHVWHKVKVPGHVDAVLAKLRASP